MKYTQVAVIALIAVAMMFVAGCTSEVQKSEVVVPTVAPTVAPVVTETAAPVIVTPTVAPQTSTVTVTLPCIGQGAVIRSRAADVTIDGIKVGSMTSAAPLTVKVTVGTHMLGVSGFPDRAIDVEFAKITNVVLTQSQATSVINAHADTESIDTGDILTFTGTGDSVHMMTLKTSGIHFVGAVASAANTKYGSGNFIVHIQGVGDKYPETAFNEIPRPTYSGQKVMNLDAGTYVISVEGPCSYTLLINP